MYPSLVDWEGLQWAKLFGLYNLFIKIDFEKACNWVERPFILAKLQTLRFGPTFIHNIETIFVDASICLDINKCSSKEIRIFKSISQGWPLASTLYVSLARALGYLL